MLNITIHADGSVTVARNQTVIAQTDPNGEVIYGILTDDDAAEVRDFIATSQPVTPEPSQPEPTRPAAQPLSPPPSRRLPESLDPSARRGGGDPLADYLHMKGEL